MLPKTVFNLGILYTADRSHNDAMLLSATRAVVLLHTWRSSTASTDLDMYWNNSFTSGLTAKCS